MVGSTSASKPGKSTDTFLQGCSFVFSSSFCEKMSAKNRGELVWARVSDALVPLTEADMQSLMHGAEFGSGQADGGGSTLDAGIQALEDASTAQNAARLEQACEFAAAFDSLPFSAVPRC